MLHCQLQLLLHRRLLRRRGPYLLSLPVRVLLHICPRPRHDSCSSLSQQESRRDRSSTQLCRTLNQRPASASSQQRRCLFASAVQLIRNLQDASVHRRRTPHTRPTCGLSKSHVVLCVRSQLLLLWRERELTMLQRPAAATVCRALVGQLLAARLWLAGDLRADLNR